MTRKTRKDLEQELEDSQRLNKGLIEAILSMAKFNTILFQGFQELKEDWTIKHARIWEGENNCGNG